MCSAEKKRQPSKGLFGTAVQKSAARINDKRRGPRFSCFPRFQFKRSFIAWWAAGKRALDADCSAGFFCFFRSDAPQPPSQTGPQPHALTSCSFPSPFRLSERWRSPVRASRRSPCMHPPSVRPGHMYYALVRLYCFVVHFYFYSRAVEGRDTKYLTLSRGFGS